MKLKKYMKIIVMIMQLKRRVSFSVVGVLLHPRLSRKRGQGVEWLNPLLHFQDHMPLRSLVNVFDSDRNISEDSCVISEAIPDHFE
jgi:hypothetical protein